MSAEVVQLVDAVEAQNTSIKTVIVNTRDARIVWRVTQRVVGSTPDTRLRIGAVHVA